MPLLLKVPQEVIIKLQIIIPFLLLLASCASGPDLSNPEVRKGVSTVKFYDQMEIKNKKYQLVKTLKVLYCTGNVGSLTHDSENAARSTLKYEALKIGANGLINYLCHLKGLDFARNCWNMSECYAEAIKIEPRN
ncbi:MAG: hypothetical protein HQK52_22920 [Oligoflexia bacterium]|nr:hypothetical protein [Oligoflexia bacterium]